MDKLVALKGKVPMTDSRLIAKAFGQEHRFTYELITNHKEQLERFGVLRFETVKPKTGRPMNICLLTEEQALMLLTYTRSRKETDDLRERLIKEFTSMRKALLQIANQKQNQEWLSNRSKSKGFRKATTDSIKRFVDYAESQGSKNASRYYGNISKMENASLFFIEQKFPNLREVMNNRQLSFIQSADTVVSEAIIEGMEKQMPYKDIYKLAKERVISLSTLIPKTNIPLLIEEQES